MSAAEVIMDAMVGGGVGLLSALPSGDELQEIAVQRLSLGWRLDGERIVNTTGGVIEPLPRCSVRAYGVWTGSGRFLGPASLAPRDAQPGDGWRVEPGDISIYPLVVQT